jgi:hypothetical protein
MTTPREFRPPWSLPPPEWIAELAKVLEERQDLVAAHYVTTRYLQPEAVQEELHLERREPPGEGGASAALFRDVAGVLPSSQEGVIFTVSTKEVLPRVREAGTVLWSREGGR